MPIIIQLLRQINLSMGQGCKRRIYVCFRLVKCAFLRYTESMIKSKALVLYKNEAAVVADEPSGGKFTVKFKPASAGKKAPAYASQSVREKDVVILHAGPVTSLEAVLDFAESNAPKEEDIYSLDQKNPLFLEIQEAYELLTSDEETAAAPVDFAELASLFHGSCTADEAFGLYRALRNTVFFEFNQKAFLDGKIVFSPRSKEAIDSLIKKADEKGREAEIRSAFIARLKKKALLPEDSKFMVDVEALALGQTDKSRTMHDAHMKETPERAHKLLLETGIWPITRNPYPLRWGLSTQSASEGLSSPPEEERLSVEGTAYAIDNAWSTDPDDAVAFDGKYLWVHIADPASTVTPDCSIDKAARERGATLYIPEGASRMLSEDSLADYALGLNEKSRALSFRILLNDEDGIEECAVFKTFVNVERLTYEKADELKESPELKKLFEIAEKNVERRRKSGAVQISMPEVHITVDPETKKVSISPLTHSESSEMIREMMLLAGEGAAKFAFQNRIPFPFVSQEAPAIPESIPEGLAGQARLRRCMRRRSVGVTPAMHCGLGLAMYSQVTSPLRRYGDLIAHMQLRAFLDGRETLDKDTMLIRVTQGEEAAQAAHKAERKSNMHWTLVYLLQNPDWTGEAVCIDNTGKLPQFSIPSLAQEAYIPTASPVELNGVITVKAASIDLPEQTVEFQQI